MSTTDLLAPGEALLGTSLALHYAPAVVRGHAFGTLWDDWWTLNSGWAGLDATVPTAGGAPVITEGGRRGQGQSYRPGPSARDELGPTAPAASLTGGAGAGPSAANTAEVDGGAVADGPSGAAGVLGSAVPTLSPPGNSLGQDKPGRLGQAQARAPWAEPGPGVLSDLASMLFLVNLVAWLGDELPAAGNTGWAWVEILGRYLLAPQWGDFAEDPIWALLAELDGRRPGTLPAVDRVLSDPIRLPQAWLERWTVPATFYRAQVSGDRLVVRQCDAFPPGHRFEDVVGAFVRWLLLSREITDGALTSRGRVHVSATHVDVVFSLDHVDLAARKSGLDRDPGWVPALGRIVLFHFLER